MSRLNRITDACFQAKTGQIVKLSQNTSAIKRRQALRHDCLTLIKTFYLHPTSVIFSPNLSQHIGSRLSEPCSGGQILNRPRRPQRTRARIVPGSVLRSGKTLVTRGKADIPSECCRRFSTRQLSVTPQCSIITTPTGWKKRK